MAQTLIRRNGSRNRRALFGQTGLYSKERNSVSENATDAIRSVAFERFSHCGSLSKNRHFTNLTVGSTNSQLV